MSDLAKASPDFQHPTLPHMSDSFSDHQHQSPRRLPQEWSDNHERYTEEITASPSSNLSSKLADRARNVITIDHMELVESETSPDPGWTYSERTAKQTCDYHEGNKATPNNNLFFEERSNPLSSKGD